MSAIAFIRLSLLQNKRAIQLGNATHFTLIGAPELNLNRFSPLLYKDEKKDPWFLRMKIIGRRLLDGDLLGGLPEWTYMVLIILILFWIEYLSLVSLLGVVE